VSLDLHSLECRLQPVDGTRCPSGRVLRVEPDQGLGELDQFCTVLGEVRLDGVGQCRRVQFQ